MSDQSKMAHPIQVGDTVAYSRAFLARQNQYPNNMQSAQGKVKVLHRLDNGVLLADIEWNKPGLSGAASTSRTSMLKWKPPPPARWTGLAKRTWKCPTRQRPAPLPRLPRSLRRRSSQEAHPAGRVAKAPSCTLKTVAPSSEPRSWLPFPGDQTHSQWPARSHGQSMNKHRVRAPVIPTLGCIIPSSTTRPPKLASAGCLGRMPCFPPKLASLRTHCRTRSSPTSFSRQRLSQVAAIVDFCMIDISILSTGVSPMHCIGKEIWNRFQPVGRLEQRRRNRTRGFGRLHRQSRSTLQFDPHLASYGE